MAIPAFGLSDADGRVYPMFDNLGAGYGLIELPIQSESNRVHSITIICYPRLMHYLKAHQLTSNIPTTN